MMNMKRLLFVILIILLLIMVFYEIFRRKHKENFRKCVCSSDQGGRERNCQDTEQVEKLYDDNVLTESTNLYSKGWSTTSPGDIDWPLSEGCNWPNNTKNAKQWQAWDFTQFGS